MENKRMKWQQKELEKKRIEHNFLFNNGKSLNKSV